MRTPFQKYSTSRLAELEYAVSVLKDLDFPRYLNPIILSEIEGVEKPSPRIFDLLLHKVNVGIQPPWTPIKPAECLHVGDDLMWCVA
jgi:FMN phosphatase YigB (HAD superfamily)